MGRERGAALIQPVSPQRLQWRLLSRQGGRRPAGTDEVRQPRGVDPDARTLQDITSRVDPPSIWTAQPAVVSVTARDLKGYVYNALEVNTYNYYAMYR